MSGNDTTEKHDNTEKHEYELTEDELNQVEGGFRIEIDGVAVSGGFFKENTPTTDKT